MHPNNIVIAKIPETYTVYIDLIIQDYSDSNIKIRYSIRYNETLISSVSNFSLYKIKEQPISINQKNISVEKCLQILNIELNCTEQKCEKCWQKILKRDISEIMIKNIIDNKNLWWKLSDFCYEEKLKIQDVILALKKEFNHRKLIEIKNDILNPEKRMEDLNNRFKFYADTLKHIK